MQGRARQSAGFSLVELVVTVTLLALVVIPVLGAVRGAVQASAISYDAAAVETALVNAAEAVQREPLDCDHPVGAYSDAVAASQGAVADETDRPAVVLRGVAVRSVSGTCSSLSAVQEVTITMTSGGVTRAVVVVKSRV
ncbi:MAG TPA: prepilin-type N-terminal cleavage/methylation domain-containing protein [Ilumatobacter sp.]|nr:prepilin-type N-terminal cleavage/methylation domain-containing protein [Ilumatobacter sp.]